MLFPISKEKSRKYNRLLCIPFGIENIKKEKSAEFSTQHRLVTAEMTIRKEIYETDKAYEEYEKEVFVELRRNGA